MGGNGTHGTAKAGARTRLVMRWAGKAIPAGCSIKSFAMRELDAADEIEAAIMAEASPKMTPATRDNPQIVQTIVTRERMRKALVEVDGRPVNHDGVPVVAMDTWNSKTLRVLERAYVKLNLLDEDEFRSFDEGGAVVEEIAMPAPPVVFEDPDELTGAPSRG